MLRLNNKYTLNKWYHQKSGFADQQGQYIDFGGAMEPNIRPASHHIFALALTIKLDIYDPKATGVSKADATKVLLRLIESLSYRHKANSKEKAWGYHWQSALWAAQLAQGAWLVWDDLTPAVRDMVAKVVVFEANRFNNHGAPYYKNKAGEVIFKGDTKAEENAWNGGVMSMAVLMMPKHENVEKWRSRLIEYQLSAYATPEDLVSDKVVDGVVLKEVLNGSNAASDGTVVNHKILHPDYMSAIMFNFTNLIYYKLAGEKSLESSLYNCDLVYKALTVNKYNGRTMYLPDAKGRASSEIYFPQGNDWGGERQANYWLMDIFANIYNWGVKGEVKPKAWAVARSVEMQRMMNRSDTGEYYKSPKEDNFFSREEWIGQHLAYGYMAMWMLE